MKNFILYAILIIVIVYLPVSATIINIPDDYETIQQGIDASTDGDTVLVQPGTYVENINFYDHHLILASMFLLSGDTTHIADTIIDGDSSGTVISSTGETEIRSIIGFTIRNGAAGYGGAFRFDFSNPTVKNNIITNNYASVYGAGIYSSGSNFNPFIVENKFIENYGRDGSGIYCHGSIPTIIDNYFVGNRASGGAGAISCAQSNAIIERNVIANNSARHGGGIECSYSNPSINHNIIMGNTADNYGGAFYLEQSNPVISNNLIIDNSVLLDNGRGGGIYSILANPSLYNNLIIANFTAGNNGYGGGIFCRNSTYLYLANNTIIGNSASYYGGGISCLESVPTIINTIVRDNSALIESQIGVYPGPPLITYSNIQGDWEGEGNIDVDPLFRDSENGDYHLMSTACGDLYDSPCIDAGHPDSLDGLLDCMWGLGTILSDMGAYGGGDSVTVGIDHPDIRLPEGFSLSQNYPNPFNAMTVIRYSLPEPSDVVIEIYDILGRKVETLVNEEQPAGYHQAVWDATDRSSGIYFYSIQAGSHSETRKMLLIK